MKRREGIRGIKREEYLSRDDSTRFLGSRRGGGRGGRGGELLGRVVGLSKRGIGEVSLISIGTRVHS